MRDGKVVPWLITLIDVYEMERLSLVKYLNLCEKEGKVGTGKISKLM